MDSRNYGEAISTAKRFDEPQKSAADREIGSVDREIGELAEAISSSEHTIKRLVERIRPVLLIQPPSAGAGQTSAPDAQVCDVASQIRTMRRSLEEMTEQVRYITERIDL